jgi:glycerol dehydrogenase-like iron-containing ADH family enzyme
MEGISQLYFDHQLNVIAQHLHDILHGENASTPTIHQLTLLSNLSDSLPSDDQQQKFTHKHL